jgi:cellulose synthase operon protein YhjQ
VTKVAIVSMKGGVGKTAIVANLGAVLARMAPGETLLVDFDPRNQLGIHFGMDPRSGVGLAETLLVGAGADQLIHRASEGPDYLPFGRVTDRDLAELETIALRRPDVLRQVLGEPPLSDYTFVLMDSPPGPSSLVLPVLLAADLVLAVFLADAASFATLPDLLELSQAVEQRPHFRGMHVLVNGANDSTSLGRDVRVLLAAQKDLPVLPLAIHRDEAVPEALACQRTVLVHAPTSQASADFRSLAEWLRHELARAVSAPPMRASEAPASLVVAAPAAEG